MRRDKSQSLPRTAYRHPAVTGGAFVSVSIFAIIGAAIRAVVAIVAAIMKRKSSIAIQSRRVAKSN